MSDDRHIDRETIRLQKETYANSIVSYLENSLKELGIYLTDAQRDKLFNLVYYEVVR